MKKTLSILSALLVAALFAGCSAPQSGDGGYHYEFVPPGGNSESGPNYQYEQVIEQAFRDTAEEPASYFSLDRNTANYSLVRAQLKEGLTIAADSVRVEELVNYFDYDYPAPEEGEISLSTYLTPCPWNDEHFLMTAGIRTAEAVAGDSANNYVLLIDVSGSMTANVRGTDMTCFELVKYGVNTLVDGLGEEDYVTVVTYAGRVGVRLEPTACTEEGKARIKQTVGELRANGSTNGSGGLEVAYEQAQKYFSRNGNNRVILLSDGDFNVGLSGGGEMKTFISEKAKSGVYLSVVAVGLGNARDDLMQTLALAGNGNYAYLDSPLEAEKIFGEELKGTLFTVAKDAKACVRFNADTVSSYRMIGYDMKTLSQEEYEDDQTDAGELGSNLAVTALYEIVLAEGAEGDVLAETEIKYKTTAGVEKTVSAALGRECTENESVLFAGCVAEFGLALRNSEYAPGASCANVLARLQTLPSVQTDPYRKEFSDLVTLAVQSEKYR